MRLQGQNYDPFERAGVDSWRRFELQSGYGKRI